MDYTRDQIEKIVECMRYQVERQLTSGTIHLPEYNLEIKNIAYWAESEYKVLREGQSKGQV